MTPVLSERSRLASDLGDRLVLLGPEEASHLSHRLSSNVHQVRLARVELKRQANLQELPGSVS